VLLVILNCLFKNDKTFKFIFFETEFLMHLRSDKIFLHIININRSCSVYKCE
jgi:hypothetical protein